MNLRRPRGVRRANLCSPPTILGRLVAHYTSHPAAPQRRLDALTARENEVLALVARSQPNDEIAATLIISIKTAETHLGNRLAKLHSQDRAQLVITAYGVDVVARS
jgi:DNA-binding CsgD family transcriptional regulator